ncbi:MAG: beta-ketoacyl-ACP synthase III [Alphaproteobacteria bacterium]
MKAVISGVGTYLPERVVTNHDLAKMVETSDEWIVTRTGISERRIAADDESTSAMGVAAARRALEQARVTPDDVDLIITATATPDLTFPATAAIIQRELGVKRGAAFDVSAACAGFIYGLTLADSLMRHGQARTALVIGAEKLSCFLDWEDRTTCVLFGDGAGAVVLTTDDGPASKDARGLIGHTIRTDGRHVSILYADGGPSTNGSVGQVRMTGRDVYRHAVTRMSEAVEQVCEREGVALSDIAWFVPHQANLRIIEAVGERLKIDMDKVIVTIAKHGNTSAASIPLALGQALEEGRIKRGDLLCFASLGGGISWGASLLRF